jgi:hypothetical protein
MAETADQTHAIQLPGFLFKAADQQHVVVHFERQVFIWQVFIFTITQNGFGHALRLQISSNARDFRGFGLKGQ